MEEIIINDIDDSTPLTKRKQIKKNEPTPQEDITPEPLVPNTPKAKRKMTKPKTEAQLKAFENARLKRLANIEKLNKEKELYYAKLLMENKKKNGPSVSKTKKQPTNYKELPKSDSDSEPEVIYVKKPKKKPKKKKIIFESDSDSSSGSSSSSGTKFRNSQVNIVRQGNIPFNPNDFFV